MNYSSLRNALSTALIALTMTGCASSTRFQLGANQQSLLQKCPPLTTPVGKQGGQLITLTLEWGQMYNRCAARHNGLVDAIGAGRKH